MQHHLFAMPFLRRNLSCFYCGTRSRFPRNSHIRQFDCQQCEATNYLDENGEITDPPVAADSPTPTKYAHYVPGRVASPTLHPVEGSLFCATCIQNQHIVNQTLASYLPPPDDPSFSKFEKSLPEYKKNLERRYPQVCHNCAPRVRERIKQTAHAAKADHVNRLLERAKRIGIGKRSTSFTWQSILFWWAGIFWWGSIIGHLIWSALGVYATPGPLGEGKDVEVFNGRTCMDQAQKYGVMQSECISTWYPEMRVIMLLAVATFWWNNKLAVRIESNRGRLIGLKDHLLLQGLMLLVRGTTWWMLQDPAQSMLTMDIYRAVHAAVFVFLAITAILSSFMVKIDKTPRINLAAPEPLLLPSEYSPEKQQPLSRPATADTFRPQSAASTKPFPINRLGQSLNPQNPDPPSPVSTHISHQTVTNTDATTVRPEVDEDTMEWTPTRPENHFFTLDSRTASRPAQQQTNRINSLVQNTTNTNERNPFRGTLPPAPLAPAHKLRNPPNQPIFQQASAARKGDFFARIMNRGGGASDAPDTPTSFRYETEGQSPAPRELELAPARLKLREDPVDTGLESLFNSVFSIRDEPKEVQEAEARRERIEAEMRRRAEESGENLVLALFIAAPPVLIGVALAVRTVWEFVRDSLPAAS
ncbi:Ima1 N-terminal domain-containing protein [Phyllosticta capitalensis]